MRDETNQPITAATAKPVVRVSILSFAVNRWAEAEELLSASQESLKAILELDGLSGYFAGMDRSMLQFSNVSFWESEAAAEQMTTFQPMLDLAAKFLALGATFVRPIPNFEILWQWGSTVPPIS